MLPYVLINSEVRGNGVSPDAKCASRSPQLTRGIIIYLLDARRFRGQGEARATLDKSVSRTNAPRAFRILAKKATIRSSIDLIMRDLPGSRRNLRSQRVTAIETQGSRSETLHRPRSAMARTVFPAFAGISGRAYLYTRTRTNSLAYELFFSRAFSPDRFRVYRASCYRLLVQRR